MERKKLILSNIILNSLPEPFEFDGDVDLTNSNIISLPEHFTIKGDLILGDYYISTFPKHTHIYGNIYLNDTNQTVFSDDIKLGGRIYYSNGDIKDIFIHGYKTKIIDGKKVTYYKPKLFFTKTEQHDENWSYPDIILYYNRFGFYHGISYTENNEEYFLCCTDLHDIYKIINIHRAKLRGVFEKYKNLDINIIRNKDELIDIFLDCSLSCLSGVHEFIEKYCEPPYQYSLRQIREKIIQSEMEKGTISGIHVFLDLFDPNKTKQGEVD